MLTLAVIIFFADEQEADSNRFVRERHANMKAPTVKATGSNFKGFVFCKGIGPHKEDQKCSLTEHVFFFLST